MEKKLDKFSHSQNSYFEWVQATFSDNPNLFLGSANHGSSTFTKTSLFNSTECWGFKRNEKNVLRFQSWSIISYNARTKWLSGKRYEYWHFPNVIIVGHNLNVPEAWMSVLCNCLFTEAIRRWNQLYAARNKLYGCMQQQPQQQQQ